MTNSPKNSPSNKPAVEEEETVLDNNTIKISTKKSTSFYLRACRNFLLGVSDKKGNTKPALDSITVSALGNAIPTAAAVCDMLERKKVGKIVKIETSYPKVGNAGHRAQLNVTMEAENPEPPTAERLKSEKLAKKMKAVRKEGGKKGVEIEGAADMGGLKYFVTKVDEPAGDVDMMIETMKNMNLKSDPADEERKGGSSHIGKMIVSHDDNKCGVVAYVPVARTNECNAKTWLQETLNMGEVGKITQIREDSGDSYAMIEIKKDAEKNLYPLKLYPNVITHGLNYLKKKGLFPEADDDDDDDMVFGDEDMDGMDY